MMQYFERDVRHDVEYIHFDFIPLLILHRSGVTSHNSTYFIIRDIRLAFEDWKDVKETINDWKDLCTFLVSQIGDVYGYIFTFHSAKTEGDDTNGRRANFLYHCSQRTNGRKQRKVDDIKKQRQRKAEERFPCNGRIRIIFNNEKKRDTIVKLGQNEVELPPNGIIVQFYHDCYHQSRQRRPFPPDIRAFIQNHFKRSASDMMQELIAARDRGELNHDLKTLTDHNIRYWWSLVRRERIETDKDPWTSALNYLLRQLEVCPSDG